MPSVACLFVTRQFDTMKLIDVSSLFSRTRRTWTGPAIISESPHTERPSSHSEIVAVNRAQSAPPVLLRWKSVADAIDRQLGFCLDSLHDDCPERLRNAIAYSLLAPGKRLRPVLCAFACEAVGGSLEAAWPGAMSLEMIHCYSLIHDDLPAMDDDDLRRGRPTCHIQFDEATAILAGDALQPLAFETLLTSDLPLEQIRESCLLLAKAAGAQGMVGGQMDDLLAEKRDSLFLSSEDQLNWLRSIHRRKTGALIQASVEMGAIAGRANASQRQALAIYGSSIGIAFQIVDDLLDVESTAENTGKATGKDSQRGKLTYPVLLGVEESREQAKRFVHKAIAAIEDFGGRSEPLVGLAEYILERSN